MSDYTVKFKDVWSKYRIKFIEDKRVNWEDIWALKNISFEIAPSETVCILGENGSGKTTLLKLIAGLIKSEKGELDVRGSVSALLEIGAGFHPELTGRENIYLNASLFGLSKAQVEQRLDKIIEFAELGKFINAPVKNYSQGMFVRLGFSIAIHLNPEILLIDDSLAVGDIAFQRKCIRKIEELQELGKTLLLVTHDIDLAKRLSSRGLIFKDGSLLKDDSINAVSAFYYQILEYKESMPNILQEKLFVVFNNGRIAISFSNYPITAETGLSYSFEVSKKECRSDVGEWRVVKNSDNKINAIRKTEELGIKENCILEHKSNNILVLGFEIDSEYQSAITNFNLRLTLSEDFNSLYVNTLENIITESNYCVKLANRSLIIFLSKTDREENQPIFIIKPTSLNGELKVNFQKAASGSNHILSIYVANRRSFNRFVLSLETRVLMSITELLDYILEGKGNKILKTVDYSLAIEEGRIILKHKDKELTNLSGLISSIYSNSRWYDSSNAIWDINKINAETILIKARWNDLPITQNWRLTLKENRLEWDIDMEANETFEAKEHKVGIFLTDKYQNWISSYEEGVFPILNKNWEEITLRNNLTDSIGVRNSKDSACGPLPGILFFIKDKNTSNLPLIQNSDEASSSRSLNAKLSPKVFKPGNYSYFSGSIKFIEDEKQIEKYLLQHRNKLRELSTISTDSCSFIVEEGRIILKHKDKELTNLSGLISSIYSNSRWYDSSNAIWDINKINAETILIKARWNDLPITQNWRLTLKENRLEWDIDMEANETFEAKEHKVGIFLTDKYQNWISSYEEGVFPILNKNWEEITLRNNLTDSIGVRNSKDSACGPLPGILFFIKDKNTSNLPLIQNSDEASSSRSLNAKLSPKVFKPGNYSYFSGSIKFIEDEKQIEKYLLQHRNKLRELSTISTDSCSFIVEEGKIRIRHKDSEVTRFSGLNNRFIYQDIEYEADKAQWNIVKLGDKTIECQLAWRGCPFTQSWLLEFLSKDRLLVEIYFNLNKEAKIGDISTELFLSESYAGWFTDKEKGDFLDSDRIGDVIPVRLLYNKSRLLGVGSVKKETSVLPMLILHNQIDKPILSTMCKLFKNSEEAVMFSLFNIPAVPLESYKEGRHLFAKFELAFQDLVEFNQSSVQDLDSKNTHTIAFNKRGTNFIFDDGKGRLFFNDTELTKALGIFTSICSSKIWHDSAQAQWKQISSSSDSLEVEGIWARLPLIQSWKFVFESRNSLLWEIKCKAYKNLSVEREQFGIMLTDRFLKWEVEKEASGIFHNDFSNQYDIISCRMWSGKIRPHKRIILLSQPGLPNIVVEFPFFKEGFWVVIENSDDVYSSRVIQAQRIYKSDTSDTKELVTSFFQVRFLFET